MKKGRVSRTAPRVALGLITLSIKDGWAKRLPAGLVEITERLLLASGVPGFGPRLMSASKRPWFYPLLEKMMSSQLEGIGHRKIFVNEQVLEAMEGGARQVLVLGAGFDTLCLRLATRQPNVQFFEVDHPATSASKANGVAGEGEPNNMALISADLVERPLSQVMAEEPRWDASQRSVIVAEGLLMYLKDEDVQSLLREAAACTPLGSRLVLTHTIPRKRNHLLHGILRVVGEPHLSAVPSEDLPEYVAGTGWTVISGVDTKEAHGFERYAVAERG